MDEHFVHEAKFSFFFLLMTFSLMYIVHILCKLCTEFTTLKHEPWPAEAQIKGFQHHILSVEHSETYTYFYMSQVESRCLGLVAGDPTVAGVPIVIGVHSCFSLPNLAGVPSIAGIPVVAGFCCCWHP
jgi:hypothetical protein